MEDNNNISPEEKMRGLHGRLTGAFFILAGLIIIGLNFLLIICYEKEIVGGESIGLVSIILGTAGLFLIPRTITIGDFLIGRSEFIKKVWAHSNKFLKFLWILVVGFSIYVFFYFLN
jgi:hypothetical protein